MRSYNETRLLSGIGNTFWQSNIAVLNSLYLFSNLCVLLSASVIAAPIMPLQLYVFIPICAVVTMMVLICSFPLLASIQQKSEMWLEEARSTIPSLRDADNMVFRHAKRRMRAQIPFGYQFSSNSFISVGTVQFVLSESISYSLLIISVAREMRSP